jgi:8-amino-7-oxononanoate synthase
MLDFTSALYLGFAHPSASLGSWRALTLGRPAALQDPPCSRRIADRLAHLSGAPAGLLFPSTLHLFRDLFAAIVDKQTTLLVDAGAYPIGRWGTEHVQLQGTPLATYPHHDTAALARQARRAFRAGLRPTVITDGLCPACGRLAPLPELARIAADYGGSLVVDDTQAMGIVGVPAIGNTAPLGLGGGGTLAWYGLHGPHVWVGSSLAKGFGAPLAVLLGAKSAIDCIASGGETRIHSSPPSVAAIAAATRALADNATSGDLLRARLLRRVDQLRQGLARVGARMLATLPLPVQMIALASKYAARTALAALEARDIRALATKTCAGGVALAIILTARHAAADIDRLLDALAPVLRTSAHLEPIGVAVT